MKKAIIAITLSAILFTACHKNQVDPVMPPGRYSLTGQWNVDAIITYMCDGAGLRDSTVYTYPAIAGSDHYSFRFNTDHSWVESFSSSPQGPLHTAASGTYMITSDSSFTLLYPGAITGRTDEPCTLLSLTNTSFSFKKQLATVFNGTDSGYIKYVFRLSK